MELADPRIVEGKPMVFAGLERKYPYGGAAEIPALWNSFGPRIGSVAGQVGMVAYGISHDMDETGFKYLACVEVASADGLPTDLTVLKVPAQRYAVFEHKGHVSTLSETCGAIGSKWLPASGYTAAGNPVMIERYGEDFDPHAGTGDMEVWFSIR